MRCFFIRETDTYGQSFFVFVLQVVALCVAIAWLWVRMGGSLLLPMLLHSAVNNSKHIVPSATPGAMNTFGFSASLVACMKLSARCQVLALDQLRSENEKANPCEIKVHPSDLQLL